MKYKLIALDMDGTLLNNNKEISKGNMDAITKASEKGVKFAVVSGRSTHSLSQFDFLKSLGTPVISYNGSKITDLGKNEVMYERGLSPEAGENLLRLGTERGATIIAWSHEKLFTNRLDERSKKYGRLNGMAPEVYTDEKALAQRGLTKMIWIDTPERVRENENFLKELNPQGVSFCTSDPSFLEVMNEEVSKAEALRILSEMLGVKREETVAVGDGENDLSMLTYAGLGVAMGNATDYVKSQCQMVTEDNEHDGVGVLVNKII